MSTSGTESRLSGRRSHRWRLAIVCGVAALAMAAGALLWIRATSQPRVIRKDTVIAVVDGRHFRFGPGAAEVGVGGGGVIRLVAGRCLGVGLVGNDRSTMIVWPRGSKLVTIDGVVQIRVPNGGTFRVGDEIEYGVTFGKERDISGLALPGGCKIKNAVVAETPHLLSQTPD